MAQSNTVLGLATIFLAASADMATAQVDTKPPAPAAEQRLPGPYSLGPDSLPIEGAPKGRLEGPFEFKSRVFAGTVRRYWVFVPAQYSKDRPANLLVFQDGQRATNPTGVLRVQQVLENLVHKKEIPVTIGLFITPGHRSETYPNDLAMSNPNNRAAEYDALSDCLLYTSPSPRD